MHRYFTFYKFTWTVFFLAGSLFSYSQKIRPHSFSQQLSITLDNDRFLMEGKDAYYTNGLIITYSRLQQPKKSSALKKINHFELGQKMYTAYSRRILDPAQIDRPIAGYLYGKYTQSRFLHRNQLLEWGISAGTIGEASLAEAFQDFFHQLISIDTDKWGWVWDYQLKTEPGINLHGRYAIGLLDNSSIKWLQLTPVSQATIGTSFTNISQGLLIQLGLFNQHAEGTYWNASLQNSKSTKPVKKEMFFYYHPEAMYQLYNSTVQGGLFRKNKGPITSPVEGFIFLHQLGALFSMHRYSFKLAVNFQTKEAESQRFDHRYGTIYAAYRFQ